MSTPQGIVFHHIARALTFFILFSSRNDYTTAFKEWKYEVRSAPTEVELIRILKESVDDAKASKELAIVNMNDNENSIHDTMKKIKEVKCQLEVLRSAFSVGAIENDGDDVVTTRTPRSALAKKRPRESTSRIIAAEIAEVFIDNDTSAPATTHEVNCSMINDFDNEDSVV